MAAHPKPVDSQIVTEFAVAGSSDQQKKMSTGKKALLIISACFFTLLLIVYAIGAIYFSLHFYPNTSLNNQDVSFKTDSEFVSEVEALVPSYELTISGAGYEQTLTAEQIEFGVDPEKLKDEALDSQNVWLWPIEVFMQHDAGSVIHAYFNHRKVSNLITPTVEQYNKDAKPCADAKIAYNKSKGVLEIKEEIYGNQLDLTAFLKQIDIAITGMETTYQIGQESCIQPVLVASDPRFDSALAQANRLVVGEIDLTLDEGKVSAGKIGKDLIASWLVLDEETLLPSLDQQLVSAWADQKSAELNTSGTSRTYTRPDGKVITIAGGEYGWKVNTADLASKIFDGINAGSFETIDIPCEQTADMYNGPGGRDWGAYVDIDISEQKVRYYNEKDEEVYSSDCVTGDILKGRSTPTGLYYLRAKKSPEILTGYNPDGSKSYESYVKYWLPFIRNSIGLHDASW